MPTVQSILKRKGSDVFAIGPEATIRQAAQRMNEQRIGSLVVKRGSQLAGIITERDILRKVIAQDRDPNTTRVEECMTTELETCQPDTSVETCRATMTRMRIRRLPVLDRGALIGIVTIGDVLFAEIEETQAKIEHLTEYLEMERAPSG